MEKWQVGHLGKPQILEVENALPWPCPHVQIQEDPLRILVFLPSQASSIALDKPTQLLLQTKSRPFWGGWFALVPKGCRIKCVSTPHRSAGSALSINGNKIHTQIQPGNCRGIIVGLFVIGVVLLVVIPTTRTVAEDRLARPSTLRTPQVID